jgi:CRP-like cAMP-binding protein
MDHPEHSCPTGGGSRCELDENLAILRGVPAFSRIPLPRLKLYAYLSKRACYQAGEFLFRQGDSDDHGYIVISGRAQLIRELKDHSVLLHEFIEGDFLGGLALFSDISRLFSVKAVTKLECLTLDRETFQKLLIQFPEVAIKVLDVMVKRVVQMEEKLLQAESDSSIFG